MSHLGEEFEALEREKGPCIRHTSEICRPKCLRLFEFFSTNICSTCLSKEQQMLLSFLEWGK
jgi:hypothetical protein